VVGAVLDQGVRILIDTGSTHNVINSSTACTIDLAERRITTTVLIGSGMELAYRGAYFIVPLHIDRDMF
jgi:predicted aspartyl protease